MSQKKRHQGNSKIDPWQIPPWEEMFITGPDPSLTPEERYDWAYDRLMEAYRCTSWNRQRALLLSIVKNPVEDKQLMTAVYATLCSAELNCVTKVDDAKERGARAEQYALKSLELKPTNTVAPTGLFMAQMMQQRVFDAFETLVKYNIDLEKDQYDPKFVPAARQQANGLGQRWLVDTAIHALEKQCRDAEKFERYYDLHIRYREAFHYTELLLRSVFCLQEVSSSAKAALCDDLARYEPVEEAGEAHHFVTLTDLLYYSHFMKDRTLLKKYLAEADALRPSCWDSLSEVTRCIFYGNRLGALNFLDRYEDALGMAPDIGSQYQDNTVLYQLTYACVHLERFDQAVQYGCAAVSLGGDEMDMEYLGRAYLGKKDYARAVESLKAAIWYLKNHSDGKDFFEFRGWTIEKKLIAPISKSYARIFKLLIEAYMEQGKYVEAEAAYREAQELVSDVHEFSGLRRTLDAQRELAEKSAEVEKQCLRLKKELEASCNTVNDYVQRMQKWSDKLVKCQLLTDEEVSDELWESTVRDKMDEVLRIAVESERASSGRFFERKLREVKKRFPKLSKPLMSYFATAEQLYANFKGNTVIDFAPVLVEYCKVVEGALWEYLPRSEDYQAHCRQWLSDPRNSKTLGGAFSIAKTCGKPLYPFRDDLEKLKKLRNDSAHVGVDRVPDVEWVRAYLWQGDLLDELTRAGS